MYDITLMQEGDIFITAYTSNIIPIIGDYISFENTKLFIVKHRILGTISNKIILIGVIKILN